MKRLSYRKGLLVVLIFFTLIVAGGIALAATDNWENPFAAFTSTTTEDGHGEGRGGEGMSAFESTNSNESASDTSTTMERPNRGEGMGEGQGGHGADGITWSQFGQVLYNVWYLFAAASVVMLVGQAIGFVRKTLRQRNRDNPLI